jgi:hypothetical protein
MVLQTQMKIHRTPTKNKVSEININEDYGDRIKPLKKNIIYLEIAINNKFV